MTNNYLIEKVKLNSVYNFTRQQTLKSQMILVDIGIALAPVLGYVSQYNLIKSTNQVGSFSIDVCAILLISNILRIFFWLSSDFATALLFQSFFIIIIQIMLLHICIKLGGTNGGTKNGKEAFWRWRKFDKYVMFLVYLTAAMTILTLIAKISYIPFYGQIVGFFSMSIEAGLGLPQTLSNHLTKSVKGLSIFMIATWFFGDFSKTLYFIIYEQPFQFIMCGTVQLTVDIIIILQILAYRGNDLKSVTSQKSIPLPEQQVETNTSKL